VLGDFNWEPAESFNLLIYDISDALPGRGEAAAFITDDDSPPALAILVRPSDQTVAQGGTGSFAVQAVGTPPLTYRWEFQGSALPGATNAMLTLSVLKSADAGLYTVWVADFAGMQTNATATLRVVPILNCTRIADNFILTWSGRSILQSSTNAAGPFIDILGAVSPHTNAISSAPVRFFRLRLE
jgi:hypothetical protein